MKSKRIIVVVVSSIVLCLCLFFIFQIEKDTSTSNKDLTLIYEEKVSPNKEYVSNKNDIVHYTIKIYQEDKNKVYVYAESNSPIFENTNYRVDYKQKISKEDIQIKWMTLSGSTEAKKSDQLGLANVKILKDGSVVNEKVISFVGKGVKAITDVIG
jgi:predicted RND superfamily exporter protein